MLRHLAVSSLFASALMAQGVTYYSAALEGAQEVPPITSTGRGWSMVRFDPATNQVNAFVFHEGMATAAISCHLHLGAVGVSGGVVLPLTSTGPNSYSGTATLTAAQATALQTEGIYTNVHTTANPGGEIRGQVVLSKATRFTASMNGSLETVPNASTGTGNLVAWLYEPENRLVYSMTSTGIATATNGHIHLGTQGVNGAVIVNMTQLGGGQYLGVSNRLTAAQMTALLTNATYANIHSSTYPSGEVRGQVIKESGDFFVGSANGSQEVPPTGSNGTASAKVVINPDGSCTVSGAFSGLTGNPVAAHIHTGAVGVSGGIVAPLTISGSSFSANFTPTSTQLADLRAGNLYFNVHSSTSPGGEVRGQLLRATVPTTFGDGCLGSNSVRPQIASSSFPAIASTCPVELYGAAPNSLAILLFGISRDSASGLPLPIDLTLAGVASPKCYVLCSPDATLITFSSPTGQASMPINVPYGPALRGSNFYTQWCVLDAAANAGGLVTSNGLTLPIQ